MSEHLHKRGIRKMNKYEHKILLLSFIPSTMLCLCMTGLLYLFFSDFGKALANEKTTLDLAYVKFWGVTVMGALWLFFIGLLIWVYREANFLVGAFERVKKELRDVSIDKRREAIIVRDRDHLFLELLDNINVIIKKLHG